MWWQRKGTIEYYYIINCICVLYVFHKFMFIVISYTLPLSLFRFIILNEFYPKNVAVITQVTTLLTKGGVYIIIFRVLLYFLSHTFLMFFFLLCRPSFFLPLPSSSFSSLVNKIRWEGQIKKSKNRKKKINSEMRY